MGNFHRRIKRLSSIAPSRHEMFWKHWNLSTLRSFYDLPASSSETGYIRVTFGSLKNKIIAFIQSVHHVLINSTCLKHNAALRLHIVVRTSICYALITRKYSITSHNFCVMPPFLVLKL
jgi:hypothetical protein